MAQLRYEVPITATLEVDSEETLDRLLRHGDLRVAIYTAHVGYADGHKAFRKVTDVSFGYPRLTHEYVPGHWAAVVSGQ